MFARGGATRGPLHPLRGCPRAWALEWERWISLRWLFGDSNTVVSSRWGLGGLRHFSGALRPFRHSSRGLPSGSAKSGALRVFVALGRIILDLWAAPPQCGYWGSMGSFCSAPQDFGLLVFYCARFPRYQQSLLLFTGVSVNLKKIPRSARPKFQRFSYPTSRHDCGGPVTQPT